MGEESGGPRARAVLRQRLLLLAIVGPRLHGPDEPAASTDALNQGGVKSGEAKMGGGKARQEARKCGAKLRKEGRTIRASEVMSAVQKHGLRLNDPSFYLSFSHSLP